MQFDGLSAGASYEFAVRAVSGAGNGPWSQGIVPWRDEGMGWQGAPGGYGQKTTVGARNPEKVANHRCLV